MRVKLTVDLTKYDARCTVGSMGTTGAPCSMWARGSDNFVGVYFDSGACLDVLWTGLEVVDQEVLAQGAAEEAERLRSAENIVRYVGPRGGFRRLSYDWSQGRVSNGFREESERLIGLFEQRGLRVRTEVER